MSIIKQISVYDGENWKTDDIGAKAENISLSESINQKNNVEQALQSMKKASGITLDKTLGGTTNVQAALSRVLGTSLFSANTAVVTDQFGRFKTVNTTDIEIDYLQNARSNIQKQLDEKVAGNNAEIKQSLTLTGTIKALPVNLLFKREGQTKGSIGLDAGTDAITLSSSYTQGENFLTLTASEGQPKVSLLKEPWQKALNLKDMFRHQEVIISNIQVPAGSSGANGSFTPDPIEDPNGNFIPLAACGYRLANAVTGGKYNEVNITSCYINQNKNIGYRLFTRGTTAANVNLHVRVLYIRSDFFE